MADIFKISHLGAEKCVTGSCHLLQACDLLVMESTYGDRNHEDRIMRRQRLGELLSKALADHGKVLIPAFALGRTQELIFDMDRIFSVSHKSPLKNKIPVFI